MVIRMDVTGRYTIISQREIAKAAKLGEVTISYIIRGKRGVSKQAAEALEFASSVPREAWMWPERWYNPYIPTSNHHLPDANDYLRIRR